VPPLECFADCTPRPRNGRRTTAFGCMVPSLRSEAEHPVSFWVGGVVGGLARSAQTKPNCCYIFRSPDLGAMFGQFRAQFKGDSLGTRETGQAMYRLQECVKILKDFEELMRRLELFFCPRDM
jgi:hypothetical protein